MSTKESTDKQQPFKAENDYAPAYVTGPNGFRFQCYNAVEMARQLNALFTPSATREIEAPSMSKFASPTDYWKARAVNAEARLEQVTLQRNALEGRPVQDALKVAAKECQIVLDDVAYGKTASWRDGAIYAAERCLKRVTDLQTSYVPGSSSGG